LVGRAGSCKSGGPSKLPSRIGASRVNKPPFEAQGKPHSKIGKRNPSTLGIVRTWGAAVLRPYNW